MSDIKLFRLKEGQASELVAESMDLERSLQSLIEKNLEPLLGVRFLASEYSTGKTHRGRIDTLVCNAAVNPYYGPLAGISDEAYDKIMNTNVRSNLWLCNMVIPQMAERGNGSVIIVSSVAAFIGSAVLGAYGLSKAADAALARNLAVEWGPKNIRANCINPAIIRTDFARALWENPETYARAIANYPLKRIGEPEEIAGAAVFLAAKSGSFVTGQTLIIDGGSTISSGDI